MISLRQSEANAAILGRLEGLNASSSARWGKMSCAQMLAHCQLPLELAAGELKLKRGLIGKLFGGLAKKKFVTSDAPFGKNSPTDPKFRVHDPRDFEVEKAKLVALVTRFREQGLVAKDPHPFFGPMTEAEWDRLLWKHLDHHLRQFGA